MKIEIEKKEVATVLTISGNLDADTVPQFKKAAQKVVDEECWQVVLDFSQLDFIDSMGLGALISLLRRVRTRQGDVKISGLKPEVRSVFEITRLNRLFEIFPDWQTALSKF